MACRPSSPLSSWVYLDTVRLTSFRFILAQHHRLTLLRSVTVIDTGLSYSIVTPEIPQCISYTLFTSIWTLLALGYLILVPIYLSTSPLAHKYAVMSVEALTMIFWFAAWIAVAVRCGTGNFLIWARWSRFWDAGLADNGVEVFLW